MHDKPLMKDWADMRMFLAIVEQGSLMAAAEQLELTQPTVGRRLAAQRERDLQQVAAGVQRSHLGASLN